MKNYQKMKRKLDQAVSLAACIILSPVFLVLCIAIKLDSPGPVFFKQKRVGIHKTYFSIYKFRTMRVDTPKDTPTHLLADPDRYITKIGRFLRKSSLDELPQLFNILKGDMSFVGPRPALWNQDDLVAERDKYGANDVLPGLTGWAQINGRDELSIPVKARLDGVYVKRMSFWFDVRCLLGTFTSVLSASGVVEGNARRASLDAQKETMRVFCSNVRRILIIGEHSYVGNSFAQYVKNVAPDISVTLAGAKNGEWKKLDFSGYDAVLHAAAIVHQKEEKGSKDLYDRVNARLPFAAAKKAKKSGVKKFVFLSTMAVYGTEPAIITKNTKERPVTLYAKSKRKAERALKKLSDDTFSVVIFRPPMVYGAGCPGNYNRLSKLSRLLFFFPKTDNKRSMIYIENLCASIFMELQKEEEISYRIVFPQNLEYVTTSELVKEIRKAHGSRTFLAPGFKGLTKLCAAGSVTMKKVFGSCRYEKEMSSQGYPSVDFAESIRRTEKPEYNASRKGKGMV